MGEGEGFGDGLGFTGCDGEGKGVGVKVAGSDGVSVAVLEGVGPGVAVLRRQSHSNRIAAIAALSLQKSRKGRSEKQLIAGEPEYLRAPRSRNQKELALDIPSQPGIEELATKLHPVKRARRNPETWRSQFMCNWQRAEKPRNQYNFMDTMTYASVAALPWSVAQTNKHPIVPEAEFPSLILSYISPIGLRAH